MRHTILAGMRCALLAALVVPAAANAQLAQTPEEASRFLLGLLESRSLGVAVGNQLSDDSAWTDFRIGGTFNGYRRGMFGRSNLINTNRVDAYLRYQLNGMGAESPDGRQSACFFSIKGSHVEGASESGDRLTQRVKRTESSDGYSEIVLDQDPSSVRLTPLYVDWSKVSFRRARNTGFGADNAVFILQGSSSPDVPYVSFYLADMALANYVENAVRVLALGCTR